MTAKILLVDDEPDIVEFLLYNLKQEGFDVITAFDGNEALSKISENPDLIILDIMMPKLDGYEVLKKIKEQTNFNDIPVIFLTARGNEAEEIKGLELGADDFIQKPISPKKLIARVKSNLRKGEKTGEGKNESSKLIIGPVLIDKEQYIVEVNGERKILPKKEFELLYYFASNPGKVLTRDILLKDIWGTDVFVVDRTIDVHIRKIREKLGKFSNLIETVKGVGYKFKNID